MNLDAVRQAVADIIDSAGLTETVVYGHVPDNPVTPCIIVYPETITYRDDYAGALTANLVVWCIAGTTDMESAQKTMDGWLDTSSPASLWTLFDTNSTLLATVDSSKLAQMRRYGVVPLQDGGSRYLQAELVLECLA